MKISVKNIVIKVNGQMFSICRCKRRGEQMINRKQLVERHFPKINTIEPLSPLSVGNGEFAFTADITGLQTFSESYQVPLGTQSHWGWHYSDGPDHYSETDINYQNLNTYGRDVSYPLHPEGKEDAYHWLRQNPHRLQLGQLSFQLLKENGKAAEIEDLENINQVLNLWEGVLSSEFTIENELVSVETVCHPEFDQISVKVVSSLIASERLRVVLRFPSPEVTSRRWEESIYPDWNNNEKHQTRLDSLGSKAALLKRAIDQDKYQLKWSWSTGHLNQTNLHEFTLIPASTENELLFSLGFAPDSPQIEEFQETYQKSSKHWQQFWNSGAAIDFSESGDSRAFELERRVVLSQFLTALHSGGSLPPQETGLIYNSWFGKFHLEMHWWHGAHFPIWGRGHILAKSLDWYDTLLPYAKDLAGSQGYQGARWPKMVGNSGRQTPSSIAPVLIWQQPHPISMAELCYQADPNENTLRRWNKIVVETANFMTSFAEWDQKRRGYVLGPPLIPAQENHQPEDSLNPPFELEYWKEGLEIAIKWAERLNEPVNPIWKEVAESMADPPNADGVYLAHENCPDTFTKYNHDHPSMVGAMGVLPGSLIDPVMMKNTLIRIKKDWDWQSAWGWDFPMCAMTAARLGEGDMAVDFLLMEQTKNTYLTNGHNYQHESLTAYLPGNGGLLTAVAMMVCGWRGKTNKHAPGFPQDGTWTIKWEGLHPIL